MIVRLAFAWATVGLFAAFGGTWLGAPLSSATAAGCFVWLFAAMAWSAYGAVKIADQLAEILGEPLGSLVLTLTIIGLEGVLTGIAVLTSQAGATIGRDALFGANMIMINFAGGLALLLGGWRHCKQFHNRHGAAAYLTIVVILSTFGFILPIYSGAVPKGSMTAAQAAGVMAVALTLYATLLWMQIGRRRHLFDEPGAKAEIRNPAVAAKEKSKSVGKLTLLLIAGVLPVLLLGKHLTTLLDFASDRFGTPSALGGVVIAIIVVSPNLVSAIKAGLANQPQRAVNLAFGSCAPALGLIMPIILGIGLVTGKTIVMGVGTAETALLVLTLALSGWVFSRPRTTMFDGAAHLTVFVIYLALVLIGN